MISQTLRNIIYSKLVPHITEKKIKLNTFAIVTLSKEIYKQT